MRLPVTFQLLDELLEIGILFLSSQKCLFSFSDLVTLGTGVCKCDVPCTRHQYDAILSSSLLDSYKIRDEIKSHEKSRELLPRYQEAVEISAQVNA